MGTSSETRVKFVSLDRYDLTYVRDIDTPYPHEESSEITHKARKKLEGAKPGDIIEVVWDYDTPLYDIVWARLITGSSEDEIEKLNARVDRLEAILRAFFSGAKDSDVGVGVEWAAEEALKTLTTKPVTLEQMKNDAQKGRR